MHAKAIGFVLTALFAVPANGQSPAEQNVGRVFSFTHIDGRVAFAEVATVIRSITDLKEVVVDDAQRTLSVRGLQPQVAMAEWLFQELDQQPQQTQPQGKYEYRTLGGGDDVVRVFFVTSNETPHQIQEMATITRSMTDIRRLFSSTSSGALVLRGTAGQIALAEWLFREFNQQAQTPGKREYLAPGNSDDVSRAFYLSHNETSPQLREMETVTRGIGGILRVFPYNKNQSVYVRGTAEEIRMAEWLFAELNRTGQGSSTVYRTSGNSDDVTRVFYFTHDETTRDLQEVATVTRSITDLRRLFVYSTTRSLYVRGTAEQVELAAWLVGELSQAASATQSQDPAPREYHIAGSGENVARVFYLNRNQTPADFQRTAVQIRSATGIRRIFTYNGPKALTVRGTAEQIAAAEKMVTELDKPN